MSKKQIGLVSIKLALILLLLAQVSHANLGVFPYRIDLVLSRGNTVLKTVEVRNFSDGPQLIEASVRGARLTPRGDPIWLTSAGKDSEGKIFKYGAIGPLIQIEPKEIVVPAKSPVEFTIRITAPKEYVPEDLAGRIGGLFFKASPAQTDEQESTFIHHAFQVTTLLLIRFKEHQRPQAQLKEVDVLQKGQGKLRFNATLKNTGNVHLYPTGRVVIKKAGLDQPLVELALSSGTTLPQYERQYQSEWNYQKDLSGEYKATYAITYGSDPKLNLEKTILFEMRKGKLASVTEE